jgi:hypothetical protein
VAAETAQRLYRKNEKNLYRDENNYERDPLGT